MELVEFYEKLDALYRNSPISEVESFLAQVNDQGITCCGRLSDLSIACLNEQGSLYRILGRYDDSAMCFETVLDYLNQQFGRQSPESITAMVNLAGTYRQKGAFAKAIELLEAGQAMLLETGDTRSYLYASLLNTLALAQMDLKDDGTALANMNESVLILKDIPETKLDQAVASVTLSVLHDRLGDRQAAIDAIDASLDLFQDQTNSPHYWAALNQKANLHHQAGNHLLAEAGYRQIKAGIRTGYGKNLDYATTCLNLSKVLAESGKLEPATSEAQEAYETFRTILGDADSRTLRARDWQKHLEA